MRAIWSGSISFGLVSIPVKMYVAIKDIRVRFNQIHSKTQARIRYQRTLAEPISTSSQSSDTGKPEQDTSNQSPDAQKPQQDIEIPSHEIIKGYNIGGDRYVTFTPEEIEEIKPKQSETIEIMDFVDLKEIDPIFFDKSYYLLPEKHGVKAFALLKTALSKTGRVGVAKFMLRSREHLALLRPYKEIISLQTIHYFEELINTDSLNPKYDVAEVAEKELKLAEALIGSFCECFDPEKYRDDHAERIRELIQRKIESRESIIQTPAASVGDQVQNLLSALEKSLEKAARERQSKPKKVSKSRLKLVHT